MNRCSRLAIEILVGVCVLLAAHALPCTAAQKLVVVVANRVTFEDLDDPSLPVVAKMLREGSIGLISPNCIGAKNEAGVMLTASSGAPSRGAGALGEFYGASERTSQEVLAGDAYYVRSGHRAAQVSAVFLGLAPVLRANVEFGTSGGRLAALGEALSRAGKRTCIIGGADRLPDIRDRSAAVLAMDSRGVVDYDILKNDPMFSDSKPLADDARLQLSRHADYVVIQYGDSVRLDEYKFGTSDTAYAARKASVLRGLNDLLAELAPGSASGGYKIVLVSFSPSINTPWSQLTPIVVYPSAKPSLLISPTTRTPGLIAASDFAPTVLKIMDVPPTGPMVGRAANEVAAEGRLEVLRYIDARVMTNRKFLTFLGIFIAIISAISFTISSVLIVFKLRVQNWMVGILKAGLMVSACTPFALLLDVLAPPGAVGYIVGTLIPLIALECVCFALAAVFAKKMHIRAFSVVAAYFITAAAVLVDSVTGGYLCRFAGPSSFQISGMRFYGIGNEYAGLVISVAAAAILLTAGRERGPRVWKWIAAVLGVFLIFVLGAGNMGANYGATAAAVVTMGLIAMALWRGKFSARHVIAVFTLGIVSVAGFALFDWRMAGGSGTHAGRLTGMVESVGPGYVVGMALRKVLMNLALTVSPLSRRIIMSFVPFLILWQFRVWPRVREMFLGEPRIIAGLKGLLIGALCAYMLNDSGIVFTCLMLGMTVLILIYSLLEELQAPKKRESSAEEAAGCLGS